jgi:hypothetical protein
MADLPLDKYCTAKMIKACQMNMLKMAKTNNSRQYCRGTRNGTFMAKRPKPKMGVPISKQSMRKVRGGKPVTPSFKTGQLRPQTKVRSTKRTHWRVVSECMGSILVCLSEYE